MSAPPSAAPETSAPTAGRANGYSITGTWQDHLNRGSLGGIDFGMAVGTAPSRASSFISMPPMAEPAAVKELDRQLNLSESVMRTKVLRPELH